MKNTRRHFLKLTSAAGIAVSYAGMLTSFSPDKENYEEKGLLKKPEWLKTPIVFTGSNQEPLIFKVRSGAVSVNVEERYLRSHSLQYVQEIKDFGGTFSMTHAMKAFGIEAEKTEIDLAKKYADLLHENSIKLGTYIGSSIAYETFLIEVPEAEEWLVPDYLGQPVCYADQYFRKRPYFPHKGYRDYIKKVIKVAIKKVGSDLIHFDNPANQAIPAVFHHPMAIKEFRAFLTKKYNAEMLRKRIGFSDVSRIVPPAYPSPDSFQSFDDPVTQEWIDFRCQKLANHYKEMSEYIKGLNPEVAVEINPHGVTGVNRAWESSVDFPRLLAHTDIFVCEDNNTASVTESEILVSNIRSYKIGRTCNNIVFNGVDSALGAAESMAFNPYSLHTSNKSLKNYATFYRNNFEHYADRKVVADVAILRSFPSMAFSNYNTHQSTILFEQSLIQGKIPFDIIFDDNLKDLSKYAVLVLANQECLRDDQLELIRNYVRKGGGLVATENSSVYDEWRRRRDGFGLKDLFNLNAPPAVTTMRLQEGAKELIEEEEVHETASTKKNQYGKGNVVYIPWIEPSLKRGHTEQMKNKFWKLPVNYLEILNGIKWAMGRNPSVEIEAPPTVVMELTEQENKGKIILHLVNFNVKKQKIVRNIRVSLKIPKGKQVQEVLRLSPEREGKESLPYTTKSDLLIFTLPFLQVYDVMVIKLV
jgi:hypothetical protein